jgi:hypothetical protein
LVKNKGSKKGAFAPFKKNPIPVIHGKNHSVSNVKTQVFHFARFLSLSRIDASNTSPCGFFCLQFLQLLQISVNHQIEDKPLFGRYTLLPHKKPARGGFLTQIRYV